MRQLCKGAKWQACSRLLQHLGFRLLLPVFVAVLQLAEEYELEKQAAVQASERYRSDSKTVTLLTPTRQSTLIKSARALATAAQSLCAAMCSNLLQVAGCCAKRDGAGCSAVQA
jgi:hypothetical protein